jgi:hypothetical protein
MKKFACPNAFLEINLIYILAYVNTEILNKIYGLSKIKILGVGLKVNFTSLIKL